MAARFFVDSPITGDHVSLSGSEAHHLAHVMRAEVGTEVMLFDGSGAEFRARVTRTGREKVELTVLARSEVDRELPLDVTLGIALPKGNRQRWFVEKAVELGVSRLVPLRTVHGVAQPVQQTLARLGRSVIEASKQCGRNRLMQIAQPTGLSDYLGAAPQRACKLIAHPGGVPLQSVRIHPEGHEGAITPIHLAVGPEGGFADEEVVAAVRRSWCKVDLGPRILRVETAAVALAAYVGLRIS